MRTFNDYCNSKICIFGLFSGLALIIGYCKIRRKMEVLEEDMSVNDILDDNDDEHERWSDFSIEEEIPLRKDDCKSAEESFVVSYDNEYNRLLCQEQDKATAAQAEHEMIMIMAEEAIAKILQGIIEQIIKEDKKLDDHVLEDFANALAKDVINDFFVEECKKIEQLQLLEVEQLEQAEQTQKLNQDVKLEEWNESDFLKHEKVETCQDPIIEQVELSKDFNHDLTQQIGTSDEVQDSNHHLEQFEISPECNIIEQVELIDQIEQNHLDHDEHDEDELFLVLHPPHDESHEDKMIDQDHLDRLEMLEKDVVHLQECAELSEANAEAAHIELAKEKSKVESLQFELKEQMNIFSMKFDQEHEIVEELRADFKRLQDERQKERESFQKTAQALQKSLQDKANVLKETEESNSLLRKEAMDLVARFSHEHDEMEQKLDTIRKEMLTYKRQVTEKDEKISQLEEKAEDSLAVLEQKKHENKKLAKEAKKLKRMLEEEKMKTQRGQRFNRILDHIDNID